MTQSKSESKNQRQLSIGIDLGTGFAAVDIFEGRRFQAVESPLDGSQIEMVVYHDQQADKFHIGKQAILRSYDDSGDNLFLHAKRNIPLKAEETVYGGRFTPVEVLTEILRFLWKLLVAARPELRDYPQFSGSKRPAMSSRVRSSTW
jgi:molecular chaperone DnaK (HSP70)